MNPDTPNLTKKKERNSLECGGRGDNVLSRTWIAQTVRWTINKQDLMKLKSFYKAKDTINRTKQQSEVWEKIHANRPSSRELIYKMYKQLKKLDIKTKQNKT